MGAGLLSRFGWLDFDTTVGNDNENRPTPQPDGTPPMQPPKAWLAAEGVVENVDTLKKTMQMSVRQMVFHDKEYKLSSPVSVNMDMKVATIFRDSLALPLTKVQKGDEGTAVSYADAMKKLEPGVNETGNALIKRFADPAPMDEVYLKRKNVAKPKEKNLVAAPPKPVSVKKILGIALAAAGIFLLFLLLLPSLILQYYKTRYNRADAAKNKSYWAYRAATYYLHMTGFYRGHRTPMQYARDMIDPQLGTTLSGFMNVYLKQKYAKQPLNAAEQQYLAAFLHPFLGAAGKRIPFKKRFFGFMNPVRSAGFFVMPEDES